MIGRIEGPDPQDSSGSSSSRSADPAGLPVEAFHDDLLVTLLGPGSETPLAADPGSFDRIRRGATRRRRRRTALGGVLALTAATAIALPVVLLTGRQTATVVPVTPLAPPAASAPAHPSAPASRPHAAPTPTPTAVPTASSSAASSSPAPRFPRGSATPTHEVLPPTARTATTSGSGPSSTPTSRAGR